MGRNGLYDRRSWMGSERGAVLMVHDGVHYGTMGMDYLVARPRKLCLAVGVDDSIQGQAESLPESEMGTILSAVVLGLFSSVFWISFSYGLFRRAREKPDGTQSLEKAATVSISRVNKKKKGM